MIGHVPCVCVHERTELEGCRNAGNSKTPVRRRVFNLTHNANRFLSLLLSLRSSSISKRLVILHTHSGWLYYEELDNDCGGVAA
jgi:hypothetical protein